MWKRETQKWLRDNHLVLSQMDERDQRRLTYEKTKLGFIGSLIKFGFLCSQFQPFNKGRVEKTTRRNEHAAQVKNTRETAYRATIVENDFTSLIILLNQATL